MAVGDNQMVLREEGWMNMKCHCKSDSFVGSVKGNFRGSPFLSSSNLYGTSVSEVEKLSANTFN